MKFGIPAEIADSDRRWNYVLLHGEDHLYTGWETSWLTTDHANALLSFLTDHISNEAGLDLLSELKRMSTQ